MAVKNDPSLAQQCHWPCVSSLMLTLLNMWLVGDHNKRGGVVVVHNPGRVAFPFVMSLKEHCPKHL